MLVDEIYVSKELCKIEVLLLDVACLQLIDVVYYAIKVGLVVRLKVRQEVCLTLNAHLITSPYVSVVFRRKVDCIRTLFTCHWLETGRQLEAT